MKSQFVLGLFVLVSSYGCSPNSEKANGRVMPLGGDSNSAGGSGGSLTIGGGDEDFQGGRGGIGAGGGGGFSGQAGMGGQGGFMDPGPSEEAVDACMNQICVPFVQCLESMDDLCERSDSVTLGRLCESACNQDPTFVPDTTEGLVCDDFVGLLRREKCEVNFACGQIESLCQNRAIRIAQCLVDENQCPNASSIEEEIAEVLEGLCVFQSTQTDELLCFERDSENVVCAEEDVAATVNNLVGDGRPLSALCVPEQDPSFLNSVCKPACEHMVACSESLNDCFQFEGSSQCVVICASGYPSNPLEYDCIDVDAEAGSAAQCESVSQCFQCAD